MAERECVEKRERKTRMTIMLRTFLCLAGLVLFEVGIHLIGDSDIERIFGEKHNKVLLKQVAGQLCVIGSILILAVLGWTCG